MKDGQKLSWIRIKFFLHMHLLDIFPASSIVDMSQKSKKTSSTIVWFQKIFMPTPNGLLEISRGREDSKAKNVNWYIQGDGVFKL